MPAPPLHLLIVAEKTSLSVVRTFDGRPFCLSASWDRSSIVALAAQDLVMVPEKTSLSVVRTFDGRAFCLSTSWIEYRCLARSRSSLKKTSLSVVRTFDGRAYIDRKFEPKTRFSVCFSSTKNSILRGCQLDGL